MINDITTGRDPDGYLYTGEGGKHKVLLPQAPPPSCKCGVSEYGEFVRKTNEVFCVKNVISDLHQEHKQIQTHFCSDISISLCA